MPEQPSRNITWTSAGTASDAFGTGQATRGSFQIIGSFSAGTLAFQVSNDGTTFTAVPLEGLETATVTIAANGNFAFPIKTFNFRYLRLLSSVSQAAGSACRVFLRD